MARREGLDKREDTTDYHSLGTVCTLRAALAVPVPRHFQIQEEEEQVHHKHWEATEHAGDGHVFTAKTLRASPSSPKSPTKWAPKAEPCRAKVGEAVGPWRRNQQEAEEDQEKLLASEDLERTQAIAQELIDAAPTGASGGLDCRFERYGRIFLMCTEGSDGEVIRAVLGTFHGLNAALLGLRPEDGEFKLRQLSDEEQEDPHLDLLTGFCILDGRSRYFVIEGLREGHSWPQLLEVIPRGPDAPKLLHNSHIGFGERLLLRIFHQKNLGVFFRVSTPFTTMARMNLVGLLLATAALGSCFLSAVPMQTPRAPAPKQVESLGAPQMENQKNESFSWAAPLLSFGAALGIVFGLAAVQPAKAITAEQFSQLTYAQVRGSGLANRCPTVESNGTEVPVKAGSKMINVCFEPKSFAVEIDTDNGKEFATTKLTTRQTYTLAFIEGNLDPNPITFKEQDGMDFAATTVKLPDGEYVPFLFTVKELVAKGEGSSFKPGFTWGGEFSVPSYRTGGFLDPKARGMNLGYDQAVALPAMQADGKSGQEDIFKETNKVFDVGRGAIEMEVNKVNQELGEIGGVFVSKQPSDTDMGAKEPKTVLLKGIFYGKVVNA
eukprot:symbB.v1.2.013486.t1/scaffold957.1/size148979/4